MKIVILGAGQVGGTLAENLVGEKHDITLVDIDATRLKELKERVDIATVAGHASYPDVLREAGTSDADMIIAVTDSDEINMIACQAAYCLFRTPTKIARIRSPEYIDCKDLFGEDKIHIDVFINPEKLVTNYVKELIEHPGALQILSFANDLVKLVAVQPHYGGFLIGKELSSLREYFPDVELRVAAIFRRESLVELNGSTVIEVGDEVFFIAASKDIDTVMHGLRRAVEPYKKVIIAGGGRIGFSVARVLQDSYQVKIIDHNAEHCKYLSEQLSKATVLLGNVSDKELLIAENIENTDVFCAVTDDDEANIMSCMQAKRLGARQTMALITRTAYVDLIEGSGINIALSPQQATISSILAYLRRGDVVNVHSLRRGAAEAIEAIAHGDRKTSKVVGRTLSEIKLPKYTTIGAIVREGKVIIPHHDTEIESEDHVILFIANKRNIRDVEKLFQVSVTFF
ncbi:MAG: potassium transporter peripheral membrane component [Coxiella sp. DG_40]|nr:MAG: potassium transporter peripheral membrane component [Coxiella sp. DG_40]